MLTGTNGGNDSQHKVIYRYLGQKHSTLINFVRIQDVATSKDIY